jgi:hypothetical protein
MSISVDGAAHVQQTIDLFQRVLEGSVQQHLEHDVRVARLSAETRIGTEPGKGEHVDVRV